MNDSNRNYNTKDVAMLTAAKTIAQNLKDNQAELSVVRSNWTTEYADQLMSKIDHGIDDYLGQDKRSELRNATQKSTSIQAPALRDLSFLKTQIEVDFDENAGEILKKLGITTNNLRTVNTGSQEALIQILYGFKKGMTPELKSQITEKGTNPELIERIIGYATEMFSANISQETLKETSRENTQEAKIVFNEINDEIIGICKIAAPYYQYDPLKKDQFTFSKVVENMGAARKMAEEAS